MKLPLSAILPRLALIGFIGLCTLSANCARVPTTNTGGGGKLLVVSFTTRGPINITRATGGAYYFVVINRVDSPTEAGPVPVVGQPWGNGFAGPASSGGNGAQGFVGFVSYSRDNGTTSNYGVWSSTQNGQLVLPVTLLPTTFTRLGEPDFVEPVASGGNRISFRLRLDRLPYPDKRWLQLNIITTDRLPQIDDVAKSWDALGDSTVTGTLSNYINYDTTNSQAITNGQQSDTAKEPSNDVRDRLNPGVIDDPGLDITDWSVQVRDS